MSVPYVITRSRSTGEQMTLLRVDGVEFRRGDEARGTFFLYVRDNGAGKDQLVLEDDSGNLLVLMTQS